MHSHRAALRIDISIGVAWWQKASLSWSTAAGITKFLIISFATPLSLSCKFIRVMNPSQGRTEATVTRSAAVTINIVFVITSFL